MSEQLKKGWTRKDEVFQLAQEDSYEIVGWHCLGFMYNPALGYEELVYQEFVRVESSKEAHEQER